MSGQQQSNGSSDKGKNLGQGLAGINDNQRRDLAGSGDDAPTQDQRGIVTSDQKGRAENTGSADERTNQR